MGSGKKDSQTSIFFAKPSKPGYTFIDLGFILAFTHFDLNFSHSRIGTNVILRQKLGIPIGGPLSSALARLVVSIDETKKIIADPKTASKLDGGRYTDDLILFVRAKTKSHADKITQFFTHDLYNKYLSLKQEQTKGKLFAHVGHHIINTTPLTVTVKNENFTSIVQTGEQKVKRFPHVASCVPEKQVIGVMIGEFVRASDCSSSNDALSFAVFSIIVEFLLIHHSPNTILKAFYKATIRRQDLALASSQNIHTLISMAQIVTNNTFHEFHDEKITYSDATQ